MFVVSFVSVLYLSIYHVAHFLFLDIRYNVQELCDMIVGHV